MIAEGAFGAVYKVCLDTHTNRTTTNVFFPPLLSLFNTATWNPHAYRAAICRRDKW